jgi:hypothetical protein
MRLTTVALLILGAITSSTRADTQSIQIAGAVDHPGNWTPDQIRSTLASEIKSIDYSTHNQKHTYNCVPLLSLLKAAGAHTDVKMNPAAYPHTKLYPSRLIIVIRASQNPPLSP